MPSDHAPQRFADNMRKCSCFMCSGPSGGGALIVGALRRGEKFSCRYLPLDGGRHAVDR